MNQPKTTILIADDEIRITQLIKDFLAASGYNTDSGVCFWFTVKSGENS